MNNDWREYSLSDPSYLAHHGILGQKWGVRRFQNSNGTLTAAGKKRYDGDKVTMHNGKSNFFLGGNKYQTHKEYKTANKFAKATYKKNKAEIAEEKKNSSEGFVKKNITAMQKNADNKAQYKYELDRNRHNAGVNEFKREVAVGAAKSTAKQAAKVGAGILAGYLLVNTANAVMDRANGTPSKSKNALATLGANKLDQHYEYSVGKKEVAKVLVKAAAMGALMGGAKAVNDNLTAESRIRNQYLRDKKNNVDKTRAQRAEEDERRWKRGEA